MKGFFESIQKNLKEEEFRHFTEYYFELINEFDYSDNSSDETVDDTLLLLVTFNSNVFKWNLDEFYFTSDIKVLIDIYIRSFHNCNLTSYYLLLCLDGVYNIIRWKGYNNPKTMNNYKIDELLKEINSLLDSITTIYNDYKDGKTQNEEKLDETQLNALLKLIENIIDKMETVIKTLELVKSGKFDYDANIQAAIKLPVDISEYSLKTKKHNILQKDFIELFTYLGESENSTEDWIEFLNENDFQVYKRLINSTDRLLKYENALCNSSDEKKNANDNDDVDLDDDKLDEQSIYPLTSLSQLQVMFASLDAKQFLPLLHGKFLTNVMNSLKNHASLGVYSCDVTCLIIGLLLFLCSCKDIPPQTTFFVLFF